MYHCQKLLLLSGKGTIKKLDIENEERILRITKEKAK